MTLPKHLILQNATVKDALSLLNTLAIDAILIVVDENHKLVGTLTDGDIRRGLIKGLTMESSLIDFANVHPSYLTPQSGLEEIETLKKRNLKIIPIIDDTRQVLSVLNLRLKHSLLPVDAVIMAGGKGQRLQPLTLTCPKPMLKVGDKPIIEYNVDRLIRYGIENIRISLNYLGEQISDYFGDGSAKETKISYIHEDKPMGTFGALSLTSEFDKDHILLMNSDILTNIDFADFYKSYIEADADLMIASIPYQVKVPYAVLEIQEGQVLSFSEKPTYNYYSNGGIYLFKRELLQELNKGEYFDATDFMDMLISRKRKVAHYPILGYWLDIGRHSDFERAQEDIKHIQF